MKKSTIIALLIYLSGVVVSYKIGKATEIQFNHYLQKQYPGATTLDWSVEDRNKTIMCSIFSWGSVVAFTIHYYTKPYEHDYEYEKANW